MPNHRLPRRALLADIGSGWKRASGGQTKTWPHQSMKSLTVKLSQVGRCRLPGWGPRDSRNQWLETIGDMAQNRCQWPAQMYSVSVIFHIPFYHYPFCFTLILVKLY
nr:unnamed protein product [Trichobilharzia regenti]